MRIAILYICTGKYDIFWKDFYVSAERYFLPDDDKTYFVFTDSHDIYDSDCDKVRIIEQADLEWPGNTLFRFKMFQRIKAELMNYDYVFFFNANLLFMKTVDRTILGNKLIVVNHPGFYNKPRSKFTYDINPQSLAYIPSNEGRYYVAGGFNGGPSKIYLQMIDDLAENIDADWKNQVVALWHDESHLNKYIISHDYDMLPPSYLYPEGWNIPFDCIVLIRDKNKYGGHDYLRNTGRTTEEKHGMFAKIGKWFEGF